MPRKGQQGISKPEQDKAATELAISEKIKALGPITAANRKAHDDLQKKLWAGLRYPFDGRWAGKKQIPKSILMNFAPEARGPNLELSYRQSQIAYGISIGFSIKEIAAEFKIKRRTVKAHIKTIYEIMNRTDDKRTDDEKTDGNHVKLALWYLEPLLRYRDSIIEQKLKSSGPRPPVTRPSGQ
jgi:hypothetical protein